MCFPTWLRLVFRPSCPCFLCTVSLIYVDHHIWTSSDFVFFLCIISFLPNRCLICGRALILLVFESVFPFCLFAYRHPCGQDVRRALKTFAHLIGVLFTFRRCSRLSCGRAANRLKIPLLLHQQVSWVCPCFSPHLEGHVFLQRNRIIAKNLDNQIDSFSESFDFYPHLSLFFPQIRFHQAKYIK